MGSKPKRYKPSDDEIALQKAQFEEIKQKDSELAEQKFRRGKGSRRRSLVSHMPKPSEAQQPKQTLGAQ